MIPFQRYNSPDTRRRAAERDIAVNGAIAAIRAVRAQPQGAAPPAVPGAPPPLAPPPGAMPPQAMAQTMAPQAAAAPVLPDMGQVAAQAAPTLLGGPPAPAGPAPTPAYADGGVIAAQERALLSHAPVPQYADGGMMQGGAADGQGQQDYHVPEQPLLPGVVSAEEIIMQVLEHDQRQREGPAAEPPMAFLRWLHNPPDDAQGGIGDDIRNIYGDKPSDVAYLWRFVLEAAQQEPQELPPSLAQIAEQYG